jgi:hypothetical protein
VTHRGQSGHFVAAVNLWTGFGGLSANTVLSSGSSVAFFGELDLELGMGFFPGMEVTGYAGMQAITTASRPLFSTIVYTPVLGVRISWGSY